MNEWLNLYNSAPYKALVISFFVGVGLCIDFSQFKPNTILYKAILLILSFNFLVMPMLIIFLGWAFNMSSEVILALIMVLVFLGGRYSIIYAGLFKGHLEYTITFVVVLRIVALVFAPFVFFGYSSLFPGVFFMQRLLQLDASLVLKDSMVLVLLPTTVGYLLSRLMPLKQPLIRAFGKMLIIVAYVYVLIMTMLTVLIVYEEIKRLTIQQFLFIVLVCLLSILFPYLTAKALKMGREVAISVGVTTISAYHLGIMLLLGNLNEGYEIFFVVFLVWGWVSLPSMLCVVLVSYWRNKRFSLAKSNET